MRPLLTALLTAALLAACHTVSRERDDLLLHSIPTGSRLALRQTLTIPANKTSVMLQNGRLVSSSNLKRHAPHCRFEALTPSGVARTVLPDEFTVVKTTQNTSLTFSSVRRHSRRDSN